MITNANKSKPRELIKEECFIAIYNQKGQLKGVVRKDIEGGGSVQMFTTRNANYSAFLDILTMLATLGITCGQQGVQPVEKVGIRSLIVEGVEVIPKLSTSFAHDIHPTPSPR